MEIVNAFFCDAAADAAGKLNAEGILSALKVRGFPSTIARLSVVVMVEAGRWEKGHHIARIRLVDAEGKDVLEPIQQPFEISHDLSRNFVLLFPPFRIAQRGEYYAHIYIDGKHRKVTRMLLDTEEMRQDSA